MRKALVSLDKSRFKGFLRTCYDEVYLENIMSRDEFQDIVDKASKVVAKVYSRKRLADTAGIESFKIMLSMLAVRSCFFKLSAGSTRHSVFSINLHCN